MRRWGWVALACYIGTIFAANWALQRYGLVPVGFGLLAPAGVFFAGAAFVLRDLVQESLGWRWTVAAILAGAALSALVSRQLALASGAAFLLSELSDFGVYTPLRERSYLWAAVLSNTAGDVVDSCLFLLLAFGSLDFLAGQLVGKWYVCLPVIAWWGWRKARHERVAAA
jgi:uncharacterized PurR-regulated membrane protein YhhQ (DUF165 family)